MGKEEIYLNNGQNFDKLNEISKYTNSRATMNPNQEEEKGEGEDYTNEH